MRRLSIVAVGAVVSASIAGGLAAQQAAPAAGTPLSVGIPFSAEEVTEWSKISGGRRLTPRPGLVKLYRDSQGRTRTELYGSRDAAAGALPAEVIIEDPVDEVRYDLDPSAHTARKTDLNPAPDQTRVHSLAGVERATPTPPRPPERTEDLGKREIEGFVAEGTRTTTTTLDGVRIKESWYSPELQRVVLLTIDDPHLPRVERLTHIVRGEPSPDLFQVPPDYTVQDLAHGHPPRPLGTPAEWIRSAEPVKQAWAAHWIVEQRIEWLIPELRQVVAAPAPSEAAP